MTKRLSLLAVFAHPDDESCGPGATLAKYAHRGVEVTLVCVTRGEAGFCDDPQCEDYRPISREQCVTVRVQELACACQALAIGRWAVLGYPDGRVAQCDRRELEGELVRWVRTVRPQVMVTCYPEGKLGHPDHDAVARVTARAYLGAGHPSRFQEHLRGGLGPWQPLKLYYCIPPDPELASQCMDQRPLTVVDSSVYVQHKIRAMRCHASQKQCSISMTEAVLRKPRWTESFHLAHSRLPQRKIPEHCLFAGVPASYPGVRICLA